MIKLEGNRGITLIALMVTILVIIVITSISVNQGLEVAEKAKAESILTNMISIRSGAKIFAEEIHGKTWGLNDNGEKKRELFETEYFMNLEENSVLSEEQRGDLPEDLVSNENFEVYDITTKALEKMGLGKIKEDLSYYIVYNIEDYTIMDIVYKPGVEYENIRYYSLSKLQAKMK